MNSSKAARGFTLIEVLIAMTLLSVMVVLLFGSLRICAQSWELGEQKISEVNEIAVVYQFFQRHLTTTEPLWNDFSVDEESLAFQGKVQSLAFVSAFPASAGRSGQQLFFLQVQEEDRDKIIKVSVTPFFPVAEGEEWQHEDVVLIRHVSDFALAYYGNDDESGQALWQDEWLEKDVLPQLIKIRIKLENATYWPDMLIQPRLSGARIKLESSDQDETGEVDPAAEEE
jgi:general secretion pathway protein J